jgi:hypothetical protein
VFRECAGRSDWPQERCLLASDPGSITRSGNPVKVREKIGEAKRLSFLRRFRCVDSILVWLNWILAGQKLSPAIGA